MKTLIKYLVAALVVIMVSCDDTEQLIYEQPNSFTLTLNQEDELKVEIQTGEKSISIPPLLGAAIIRESIRFKYGHRIVG